MRPAITHLNSLKKSANLNKAADLVDGAVLTLSHSLLL
jgi:hypothetical protein